MNGRHWALVSLLAAASCTVGPDYVRPEFFDDGQLSAALEAGSGESFRFPCAGTGSLRTKP